MAVIPDKHSVTSTANFIFRLPEIRDVSISFKYHYFTQGEGIYPANNDLTLSSLDQIRYGYPREIVIDLKGHTLNKLSTNDEFANSLTATQIEQILSSENFSKALQEFQLQTRPASVLAFKPNFTLDNVLRTMTVTDSYTDHYASLSEIVSNTSSEVQAILEEVLSNEGAISEHSAVFFDPTTNLPITDFDNEGADFVMPATVYNPFIGDVISSVTSNYLSYSGLRLAEFEAGAKTAQRSIRQQHISGLWSADDYVFPADTITYDMGEPPTHAQTQIGLIGIVAYKTLVSGTERIPKKPIVLISRDKSSIIDTSVVYGEEYEYSLHTLAIVQAPISDLDPSVDTRQAFLLLSPVGTKCSVKCIEAKPPQTVSTMNFVFLESSMLVEWSLPSQVSANGKPVNDIKYVQIFSRSTTDEPFKLYAMYDFNDSAKIFGCSETFPVSRVIFTKSSNNTIEVPLPTYGHPVIWTVCTVDAHGNSSNYASQYRVVVDSLGNHSVEHVAYPGSPKQYPNLTLATDAFVDSLKVSNCSVVDIYHNPTITKLITGGSDIELINKSQTLSSGEKIPSYQLQLIDLETQKDQVINFIIKEK